MNKVALITGGSGGIGFEIAKLFAKDKINVVLVSRSINNLLKSKEIIESQFDVKAHIVNADLSIFEGLEKVKLFCSEENLRVEYLVNNAGFGDYGAFVTRSIEKYREMIGLNISMLTELTYFFVKKMVENGSGRILNVSSVAGIQPVPYFAVYGASKAYVINFTEALHKELEKTGVTATVLSPGVTETGFMARADMHSAEIYRSGVMQAADVAIIGYSGMMKGKLQVIPGIKHKLMALISSMTPSSQLRLTVSANIMKKAKS
jgi:short-subunit dehydrogenase